MTPGMFLLAAILAAILLYVVLLGPLRVAWIFYKSHRATSGFGIFCQGARAREGADGAPQTVTIGGYDVQLVCLSESNRIAFSEAPIAMPPPWWKLGRYQGGGQPDFWPQDNRGEFLDAFPYEPININHGPVLVLISEFHHPFPFAIRRRRVFQRPTPQEIPREDTEFSRKVSVFADDQNGMRDYLTEERRAAILELFALGIDNIMYVKKTGRLVLASSASFLIRSSRTGAAPHILKLVRKLLPEGPRKEPSGAIEVGLPPLERQRRVSSARSQAITICIALLLFTPIAFAHTQSRQLVSGSGFIVMQAAVTVAILAIIALLRWRRSLWKDVGLLWIVLLCATIPVTIGRTMALMNSGWDRSEIQHVEAIIEQVSSHTVLGGRRAHSRSRRGFWTETHYEVDFTLSGCQGDGCSVSVEVPEELAEQLESARGSRAQVSIRGGALGFPHATGHIALDRRAN